MQGTLALPSPDLSWRDENGEPLSLVGPTASACGQPFPPRKPGRIAF